ncbi:MAG TPA: NifB/NifX family molybdenum-iron cluster-binding protein [Bacteroidales bacterium]|nr:NifB/NifX family molybdenum-iron cluster-binding protein [Bacteroidales bacterium]HPT21414.1 NifB/NifX family molybdenum-iron cluster-binding protein [Bacteroidales bacterium]
MKIAVPVTRENQIDSHFGHCEGYGIFTISDNKEITDKKNIASPQGCGCKSNIASTLAADGVTVMLAGGIGDGAINVLNYNGIEVIRGCSGDATEVVKLYLSGLVEDSGNSCHSHDHECSHN